MTGVQSRMNFYYCRFVTLVPAVGVGYKSI